MAPQSCFRCSDPVVRPRGFCPLCWWCGVVTSGPTAPQHTSIRIWHLVHLLLCAVGHFFLVDHWHRVHLSLCIVLEFDVLVFVTETMCARVQKLYMIPLGLLPSVSYHRAGKEHIVHSDAFQCCVTDNFISLFPIVPTCLARGVCPNSIQCFGAA